MHLMNKRIPKVKFKIVATRLFPALLHARLVRLAHKASVLEERRVSLKEMLVRAALIGVAQLEKRKG